MVPTSFVGVTILVLLVLPGIVLELLRQRSRPGRSDSVFIETARVLLGGALLTVATLLLLGAVRTTAPAALADPRMLWSTPRYVPDHLWLTGWTVALFMLLSATLAALCYALAPVPGLAGRVLMESAWVTTFGRLPQRLREEQPDALRDRRIVTQLQVQLTDGSEYLGMRDAYSAETAMSDRELVLAPPLQSKRSDGPFEPMDEGWQRVIIPAAQIRSIAVRFTAASESSQPSRTQRGAWLTKTANTWTTSPARLAALLTAELVIPIAIGIAIRLV